MSDYIDRQVALDALGVTKNATKYGDDHSGYDTRMLYEIQDTIESIEPADVVEVVRCRDCIYQKPDTVYGGNWCWVHREPFILKTLDGFCSYGERMKE